MCFNQYNPNYEESHNNLTLSSVNNNLTIFGDSPQTATSTMLDQACGCEADSGDPDYACDCAMQGACICSADCKCNTDVCKEAVGQLS